MPIILGIESTAHTFGIAVVKDRKILSNCKKVFTTESGGLIPMDVAKHHSENKNEIYFEALDKSNVKEENIDAVAFSQGPGLAPCLLEGMKFAKELSRRLKKPLVPVNHCVAHLEIGKITGAENPVMLYASGANTQIIAYSSGKYRIFGETLDLGVGNFIDTFARYAGIGFPGGPAIQKLASESKNYVELPYSVKGMDVAFSGILTNLKQKLEKINQENLRSLNTRDIGGSSQTSSRLSHKNLSKDKKNFNMINYNPNNLNINKIQNNLTSQNYITSSKKIRANASDFVVETKLKINNSCEVARGNERVNYTLQDLCYSLQETIFAMLVETTERALAHTGKKELLLGGGVACNSRLQEMCKIMCEERGVKFFAPEKSLLVDNAGMIAYLGEIMFNAGIKFSGKKAQELDILPRQRTDEVEVSWK